MEKKKTFYQLSQKIAPNIYLCSNFRNETHILLAEDVFKLYDADKLEELKQEYPQIFERLEMGKFLVPKDADEFAEIQAQRKADFEDTKMYQLIINPTLDCNLSCWYCYENKIPKSAMSEETINAIAKNIEMHYEEQPFSLLKLSFFGGEPFMRFHVIKAIVEKASLFCKNNNIRLLLDFTTNGTLCTQTAINFLKDYPCNFQITLDGNREQHNKIKHTASASFDAFGATVNNIKRILDHIKNSFVAVRINFDQDTLKDFDSILNEIQTLDRKRCKIILKKIWQVDVEKITQSLLLSTIEKLYKANFVVDYYGQGGVCLCDRKNEAVINYDGNVYKCTTIPKFDEASAMGHLDAGTITWNKEKTSYLNNYSIQSQCKACRLLPKCGGPCQKKMEYNEEIPCFLNDINFNMEEYTLMQFNINIIKERIYANKNY